MCSSSLGEGWERGKRKRRGRKVGEKKKESESGDFLPVLCVWVTDFYLSLYFNTQSVI
jgi:hypothetical protein